MARTAIVLAGDVGLAGHQGRGLATVAVGTVLVHGCLLFGSQQLVQQQQLLLNPHDPVMLRAILA
jgi:hypothetical protein